MEVPAVVAPARGGTPCEGECGLGKKELRRGPLRRNAVERRCMARGLRWEGRWAWKSQCRQGTIVAMTCSSIEQRKPLLGAAVRGSQFCELAAN